MSQIAFQAWDDFDTYTIGTNVAGATVRGGGGVTYKPQYTTAVIAPFKKRYLELVTATTSDFDDIVSFDAVDADANRAKFDIVTCLITPLATVQYAAVYARGQGTATVTAYYRARLNLAGNSLHLDKMVASVATADLATAAFTFDPAKSYLVRFQGNLTALKIRVWDAALGKAGEPTTWNISTTDASVTAAGWVGLAGYHGALTAKVAAFNFLAVATNGDSAVCPRTNTERTAWLGGKVMPGESGLRAVAAKMRATGYDSSGSPYTATRKAYIANHGYTSAAQDTPALQHFDNFLIGVPTFSREMPAALSGQAVVNIGKMRVSNPAVEVPVRQNLLLRSEQFDNASWSKSASTISANAIAAPDGATTADKLQEDNTNAQHVAFQAIAATNGIEYVWSIYAKAAERTMLFMSAFDGVTDKRTWFNLSTGAVGTNASGNTAAMEDVGGGWYRCTIKRVTADIDPALTVGTTTGDGVAVYLGTTGNGIYIWGAQIRQSNRSVQYVQTVAAAFNPAVTDQAPGVRDDWARIHWLRDGFELLMGDPTWALHDFLHLIRGRLGNPTCPELGVLEFPIADMSEFFNKPLVTDRFTTGNYIDQQKPLMVGNITNHIELPLTDTSGLVYQLTKGTCNTWFPPVTAVYNNGVALTSIANTIAAVNAGTDTITATANHGFTADWVVYFGSVPAPPTGVAADTKYYVIAAGLTLIDFRISATRGGAAVNITGAGTGASISGQGWRVDETVGTVTLVDNPGTSSRITIKKVWAPDRSIYNPADVVADILFTEAGMSLNYKDAATFTTFYNAMSALANANCGLWKGPGVHLISEWLSDFQRGTFSWCCPSFDGLIQVGTIDLPAATASRSFVASDVKAGTLRLVDVIRPINFVNAQVSYKPAFLTGGPLASTDVTLFQAKAFLAAYSYGAASIPLDNYPTSADATSGATFDLIVTDDSAAQAFRDKLAALYLATLGVFEFVTTLAALEVNLGDTISLDFPRLGWKQWTSADPASPDNTATIDSRLAVVIGMDVNVSEPSPFKVRLKVMRRIPGNYPIANLN